MNTLNPNAVIEKVSSNQFLITLNAFVKREIVISEHGLIYLFEQAQMPIQNKLDYAEFILNQKLVKEDRSIEFFKLFISQNTPEVIGKPNSLVKSLISFVRHQIQKIS